MPRNLKPSFWNKIGTWFLSFLTILVDLAKFVITYTCFISTFITTYLTFHSLITKDPVYAVLYALTGVLNVVVVTLLSN